MMTPIPIAKLAFWAGYLALLAGCPTRPNPEAAGLTCNHASHICVGALSISSPGPKTYTNARVTIQIAVTPSSPLPEHIEIQKDGASLISVSSPFTYSWDTTKEVEGPHQIGATTTIGGQTVTASPITVVVDRTPPTITRQTPAPNAQNIALSDPIQLVFSEAIDPASVPGAAVTLTAAGATQSATATLGSDGTTIDVTLGDHVTLALPATMEEFVLSTITDLAGNPLGTVPHWSWTAPLWVKLPQLPGEASVALGTDGSPMVAFTSLTSQASSTYTLATARYRPGAVWDLGLGTPTANSNLGPSTAIAVDASNSIVVAWSDGRLHVARQDGSAWDLLAGNLDPDLYMGVPILSSRPLSVVLDLAGSPLVGFESSSSLDGLCYVSRWSGSTWQLLSSADAPLGRAFRDLHLDSSGVPYVLVLTTTGTLALKHYRPEGWDTIDTTRFTQVDMFASFALDAHDRPVILTHNQESNVEVIHARLFDLGVWADLTPALVTGSASVATGGRVVLDSDGNPAVIWSQNDSSGTTLLHVAHFGGSGWDAAYGTLPSSFTTTAIALDKSRAPTVMTAGDLWKSNR